MPPRRPIKGNLVLLDEKGVCYEIELKELDSIELSRESEEVHTADRRVVFTGGATASLTLRCRELDVKAFLEPDEEPEVVEDPASWEEMILEGVQNAD